MLVSLRCVLYATTCTSHPLHCVLSIYKGTNMSSYKDLLAQRANLNAQIEAARKSEVQEALSTIRGLVDEFKLTVTDVFPAGRTKRATAGTTVAPKYRDPNTGATWTGRGKPPLWITNKDRVQFEIGA